MKPYDTIAVYRAAQLYRIWKPIEGITTLLDSPMAGPVKFPPRDSPGLSASGLNPPA